MKNKVKVWICLVIVSLLLAPLLPLSDVQAALLDKPQIAAGSHYTVGLRQDGTVVSTGDNSDGQRNIGDWSGMIYVTGGTNHTVGVTAGGKAVAAGRNNEDQCNVSGWSDIVQVAAGWAHTVGLKSNGTVVAVGDNKYGELNVSGWSGIVQVEADDYWSTTHRLSSHTIGLKSDGTVVAVGKNTHGQLDVGGWTDIIQVAAGGQHTVGLKSDGTVVAVGDSGYGKTNVSGWSDIVYIAAGDYHTLGVRSNGRVVATGRNNYGQLNVGGWRNIIQVDGGRWHSVGAKADGTAVATGLNGYGQCNVSSWDLTSAYEHGYNIGYQSGYQTGYNTGRQEGYDAGYENGYRAAMISVDIQAVGYRLGEPPPSYDGSIRESNLDIEFENTGNGDAFSAYGYVISVPDGVTVPQSFAWIGDIPAGSSIWSDNPITIRVDTANPPDPGEGIVWYFEYYDEDWNYRDAYEVIQLIDFTIPVADANGPYTADEGANVMLDASGSYDPGDGIVLYEWDTDDDGMYDNATGVTTNVVFDDDGVYAVGLKVSDGDGEYDTDSTPVTVMNVPPAINALPDQVVNLGNTFLLNAEFTDPGSLDAHMADIHWGDGDIWSGVLTGTRSITGSHVYAWSGDYNIEILVTDDDGGSDIAEFVVTVLAVPDVMVLTLGAELGAMGLPAGTMKGLQASLDTAAAALQDANQNNDAAAVNALEAFINELEAQRDKKIPGGVCDMLIARAQEIITAIGGGL